MRTITYSLKNNNYYSNITSFTEKVINKVNNMDKYIISNFMAYIEKEEIENLRSREEYIFEFLAMGVLWELYAGSVIILGSFFYFILSTLYDLRDNNKKLKPVIDILRGILATLVLYFPSRRQKNNVAISEKNFNKFISWLEATGEYSEEVKRFKNWRSYFNSKPEDTLVYHLDNSIKLAEWFKKSGKTVLGPYTENVEDFLQEKHRDHLWREDVLFCGKREVEYHLNMVGARIMNQAFQEKFKQTREKIVLLPTCMRNKPAVNCSAEQDGLHSICTGCSKDCNINRINQIAENEGHKVVMISHSSSFSALLKNWQDQDEIGLVGVACVLNLLLGGYEMKSLNIPAQCVLLDCCGCKNHWDQEGIPTNLNQERLLEIINKK